MIAGKPTTDKQKTIRNPSRSAAAGFEKRGTFDAEAIKSQIDCRDLARQAWGDPKRSRARYDQHFSQWRNDGRKPSFTVYFNGYKDQGGKGDSGDVLDFIMKQYGLTFPDAVQWAADYIGGAGLASQPTQASQRPVNNEPPSANWQQITRQELEKSQNYLWSGMPDANKALDYLRHKRGLTDDAIRRAGLGYLPSWTQTAFCDEDGKRKSIPPGVVIPYWIDGILWALRVRCRVGNLADALNISEDQWPGGEPYDKYLNFTGSKVRGTLYGADDLIENPERPVLMVEGETDCILAKQLVGDSMSVITLGPATNSLAPRWQRALNNASRIILALDADTAGQAATKSLIEALPEGRVYLAHLPAGYDITDYVMSGGNLQQLIADASKAVIEPVQQWQGLSNFIRSTGLLLGLPLHFIEMVTEAAAKDMINPKGFTTHDLNEANIALGYCIPQSSMASYTNLLLGLFFQESITTEESFIVIDSQKNTGRKAKHYECVPLHDVMNSLKEQLIPRIYEDVHQAGQGVTDETLARPLASMLESVGVSAAESGPLAAELDNVFSPAYEVYPETGRHKGQYKARKVWEWYLNLLESEESSPLPAGWPKNNLTAYRAAYLRAWFDHYGKLGSNAEKRRILGICSTGSVKPHEDRAGIEGIEQYAVVDLKAENITHEVNQAAIKHRGRPRRLIIGETESTYDEWGIDTARAAIRAGKHVSVKIQVANTHEIVRDTPPEPKAQPEIIAEADEKPAKSPAPRQKSPAPAQRPQRKPGEYDPVWVEAQIRLGLKLLDWITPDGSGYCNPVTGETIPVYATPLDLIEFITGQLVHHREPSTEFAREMARELWGKVAHA